MIPNRVKFLFDLNSKEREISQRQSATEFCGARLQAGTGIRSICSPEAGKRYKGKIERRNPAVRNRTTNWIFAFSALLIFLSAISPRLHAQQPPETAQPATTSADLSGLWSRLRDAAVPHPDYDMYILDYGKPIRR